jgi:ATP-dependent DNA ligase
MHARLDAGRVKIITRRGNDWTQKYPAIAKAIAGLPAQDAYLDGELCARMKTKHMSRRNTSIAFKRCETG